MEQQRGRIVTKFGTYQNPSLSGNFAHLNLGSLVVTSLTAYNQVIKNSEPFDTESIFANSISAKSISSVSITSTSITTASISSNTGTFDSISINLNGLLQGNNTSLVSAIAFTNDTDVLHGTGNFAPFIHNSLSAKQGLGPEYIHLDQTEYTDVTHIPSLSSTVIGHTDQISALSSTVTSHTVEINSISATVTAHTIEINSLSSTVTGHTIQISALSDAISSITGSGTSSHAAVTLGTANGLTILGQQLSLSLASSSLTGALSNTDWSTFNSKQNSFDLSGLSSTVIGHTSQISSLSSSIISLSGTVTGHTGQINSLNGSITSLSGTVSTLSSSISSSMTALIVSPLKNQAILFNGTNWVNATQGTSFTFSIATFTCNFGANWTVVESGTGVWKAIGALSFSASYNNGPATTGYVSHSGWSNLTLTGTGYVGPTISLSADNFPSVGSSLSYTLNATDGVDPTTSIIYYLFYNRRYWGITTSSSGYSSSSVTSLANNELSNSIAKTFTVAPGATEYILWASPKRLGVVTFTVGGFSGGFQTPETVAVKNASGYTEDYYVYRSTNINLGSTNVTTS